MVIKSKLFGKIYLAKRYEINSFTMNIARLRGVIMAKNKANFFEVK